MVARDARSVLGILTLGAALALAGCGGSDGKVSKRAQAGALAAAASSTSTTSAPSGPSAYNVLAALPAPTGTGAATTGTATTGATTTGAATTGATTTGAATTGAALHGTIPPDPATGFDGQLYLSGERLVPGTFLQVWVNGTFTKVLPATFYSSELLSTYVHLTVPADYDFVAVAPDGSTSAPLRLTVPAGNPAAYFGLLPPVVHMVYPPDLTASFTGTVWLMGESFVPGCFATVLQPGVPPLVVPLTYVNERTVAWTLLLPPAGDVTLQVTNPSLLSSGSLTLPVGPAPAAGAAPQAFFPGGVTAPFLGSVRIFGADLALGATVERRDPRTGAVTSTPLVRVSPVEALWTLVYPGPGTYEVRVVNPGGAASPWSLFDVR